MMKKVLKTAVIIGVLAVGAVIMWKHTQMESTDMIMQAETVEEVIFPEKVERKVNENFSYDAVIKTGNAFCANKCYKATATIQKMQKEKWKEMFLNSNTEWAESEDITEDREGHEVKEQIYEEKEGAVLYLSDLGGLYGKYPDMTYIAQIFDTNPDAEIANPFSTETDLDFISKEDAFERIKNDLQEMGMKREEIRIRQCYSLDAETMQDTENALATIQAIEEKEKKTSWNEQDEGYFVFIEQESQGLPVYTQTNITNFEYDQVMNSSIMLFYTADSYKHLEIDNWFDIKVSEEKYQLLPFEKIMETIDRKYKDVKTGDKITVTSCELYEYPQLIEAGSYQMLPIWICTITMEGYDSLGEEAEYRLFIPINAVTGEEILELEE